MIAYEGRADGTTIDQGIELESDDFVERQVRGRLGDWVAVVMAGVEYIC
jgi:hypothetical protein